MRSTAEGLNIEPRAATTDCETAGTRERLLDAAERIFAESGYRAGSVREITRDAQCNLGAVNYHFGSKSNLYREVFLRRLAELRQQRVESINRALEEAGNMATLELLLRAFTSAFLEPLVEESTGRSWVKLMSREMLDPQLPSDLFISEMIEPVQEALVSALCGLCSGLSERTAALCSHSLVAQLAHAVHLRRYLDGDGNRALPEGYHLPSLVDHVVRFSAAGIRALADRAERRSESRGEERAGDHRATV